MCEPRNRSSGGRVAVCVIAGGAVAGAVSAYAAPITAALAVILAVIVAASVAGAALLAVLLRRPPGWLHRELAEPRTAGQLTVTVSGRLRSSQLPGALAGQLRPLPAPRAVSGQLSPGQRTALPVARPGCPACGKLTGHGPGCRFAAR